MRHRTRCRSNRSIRRMRTTHCSKFHVFRWIRENECRMICTISYQTKLFLDFKKVLNWSVMITPRDVIVTILCIRDPFFFFLSISRFRIRDYPIIFNPFRPVRARWQGGGGERGLFRRIGFLAIFFGELSSIFLGECKTTVLDFPSARAYRKRAEFGSGQRFRVLFSSGVFAPAWPPVELCDDCFLRRPFPLGGGPSARLSFVSFQPVRARGRILRYYEYSRSRINESIRKSDGEHFVRVSYVLRTPS